MTTTYTIHFYRNGQIGTFTSYDFRAACIIAYNEVYKMGCEVAHITSGETGELLRTYEKG